MFKAPIINFSLRDSEAELPYRESAKNIGYKFKALETRFIPSNNSIYIDTGLSIENIEFGVWGMILPVEESNDNQGAVPVLRVIDNLFRGELIIKIHNYTDSTQVINKGDEFAQIAFFPHLVVEPEFKINNE